MVRKEKGGEKRKKKKEEEEGRRRRKVSRLPCQMFGFRKEIQRKINK